MFSDGKVGNCTVHPRTLPGRWGGGGTVILHHPNVTDVRTAAPDRSSSCPYLSADANSTEFDPESKHPVVGYLSQPRSLPIKSSPPLRPKPPRQRPV